MSEQNFTPDNADDTEGHYLRVSQPTDPGKDSIRTAYAKFVESQREGDSETSDDTEGHVLRQKSDPTDPKKDVSESHDTEGHVQRAVSDDADNGDDTEGHVLRQ